MYIDKKKVIEEQQLDHIFLKNVVITSLGLKNIKMLHMKFMKILKNLFI